MTMRTDTQAAGERSSFYEEFDAPVDAWSLDELAQLSDLDSIRSAWGRSDPLEG